MRDFRKVRAMNRKRGFTLIELVITVALAAILLTIGVPSFQQMIRNNRAATHANEFMSALNLARSEAVKRSVRVSLCPSTNQVACTGGTDWSDGWIVFVDTAATDADAPVVGEVLRVGEALSGNPTFTGPTNIRYRPAGDVIAQGQFGYGLGTNNHLVCVSPVGRPRIDKEHTACP